MKFSVCVLLYGDHLDLAERCLSSISGTPGFEEHVSDVRLGLHALGHYPRHYVMDWTQDVVSSGIPVHHYVPRGNIFKYPTMRRMFCDKEFPIWDYIMWFDDDSYLTREPDFWDEVKSAIYGETMIGQHWQLPIQGKQWSWIMDQSWSSVELGRPPGNRFTFCQGGWWVVRRSAMQFLDWPTPALRHCGGDSMLGEALRHTGVTPVRFDYGVRINADADGNHSKATRRGHTEKVLGSVYYGTKLPTDHQDFITDVFTFTKTDTLKRTIEEANYEGF